MYGGCVLFPHPLLLDIKKMSGYLERKTTLIYGIFSPLYRAHPMGFLTCLNDLPKTSALFRNFSFGPSQVYISSDFTLE